MATTAEIMVGGIALLVNTFAVLVSFFIGNAIMAPIVNFVAGFPIHPALQTGMWEITYVLPSFFGYLLVMEILIIVGFVYILARRQVTPYEY